MKTVLITGATGNIGQAVLKYLDNNQCEILTGVTNIEKSLIATKAGRPIVFNFETQAGYDQLTKVDCLFLLRPPHITDVDKYFKPLLEKSQAVKLKHLVFLSVQGAETSDSIPHRKIEKLIMAYKLPYTFIRPGYFMENLNTTLYKELIDFKRIFMPSGNLIFNWTDIDDIGRVTAQVITEGEKHFNQAYEITGDEQLSFPQVINRINKHLGTSYVYKNPNVITYIIRQLSMGINPNYLAVMLLLHFLPRFQTKPALTTTYHELTGMKPNRLEHYLDRKKILFIKNQPS